MQFEADWVQNDATVDFDNGFIEVYRDARGAKEARRVSSPSPISPSTTAMKKLGRQRRLLRRESPWDPKYKTRVLQTAGGKSG